LLIDPEEDRAARAVIFGLLAEMERRQAMPPRLDSARRLVPPTWNLTPPSAGDSLPIPCWGSRSRTREGPVVSLDARDQIEHLVVDLTREFGAMVA
jgi:hypothetical protein